LPEYNVLAFHDLNRRRCWRAAAFHAINAALLIALWAGWGPGSWAATISVAPDGDAFLRSLAATSNYGAGGALSVSGSAAVNGTGQQNGLFDTLMRFPMSNVMASLDAALGGHDWVITGARLLVTEMASPDNARFNRGVGAFEIRWIAADGWLEGSGKPMTPTTDGVAWQDLPSLLNPGEDRSLAIFTNAGANAQISFALGMPDSFLADLRSGGELSLYLTTASPEIGFTFNSRDFGNTNAQPALEVTALANPRPVIDGIVSGDGNVVVTFRATTNWVYRLQRSDSLGGVPGAPWADVLTIPAQISPTNVVYAAQQTNGCGFYRLSLSL
jgi:hypothetical protein